MWRKKKSLPDPSEKKKTMTKLLTFFLSIFQFSFIIDLLSSLLSIQSRTTFAKLIDLKKKTNYDQRLVICIACAGFFKKLFL